MVWSPSLNAREMIILTCEEPPTNYSLEEDIVGTSVDIVQAILARLEQKNTVKLLPWARAYKTAVNKPNVIVFTSGMTQNRVDLGFFLSARSPPGPTVFSLSGKEIFF